MLTRIYPECVSHDQSFIVFFFGIKRLRTLFQENTDIYRQKVKSINLSNISHYNIIMTSIPCFLAVQAHCGSVFHQSLRFYCFPILYYFFQSKKEIMLLLLHFPYYVELCELAKNIHIILFWMEYSIRKPLGWRKTAGHDWGQSPI